MEKDVLKMQTTACVNEEKGSHASLEYCLLFQQGGADLRVFFLGKTCVFHIQVQTPGNNSNFVYAYVNQKKFIRQVTQNANLK